MRILVTGGTGYIGSHTCVALLENGFEVIIADNLSNSERDVVDKIEKIAGIRPVFYEMDLSDGPKVMELFQKEQIDGVIHFAGLKAVGESVAKPLRYYDNNLTSTINLLKAMARHQVYNFIFSSSATVYGQPERVPITEDFPTGATNPYGATKLIQEWMLRDLYLSNSHWNIMLLRYFNPIGAHESGLLCENPKGIPNNLMPYILQVAAGKLPHLNIFGNDYETPDGTGVRDYIHVMDLAEGHIAALKKIQENPEIGLKIYNLGTGKGYSVLEIVQAFENVKGSRLPHRFAPRRPGDVDMCYADCTLSAKELGWTAKKDLNDMCKDSWRAFCMLMNREN